jgi:hypothetical protein
MNISKNGLDVIKNLIVDLNVEACGFLIPSEDESTDPATDLQVYIDSYGEHINGRGVCNQRKYTKYIWHTHPSNLIAYVSPEDILKILKKRPGGNPQVSVVFTKWGSWYLYSERKVTLDENWKEYFTEKIKQVSRTLYERSEKGRGRFTDEEIKKFIDSVKEVINKKLNVNLEIRFTGWTTL